MLSFASIVLETGTEDFRGKKNHLCTNEVSERLSLNTLMPASRHFLYQNILLGEISVFPKSATDVSGPRFHPRHKGRAAQGKHRNWYCRGL